MEMGKDKNVALLIGIGKGGMGKGPKGMENESEGETEDSMGGTEAGKELLAAIEAKDAAAVYEAMKSMVELCSGD